MTSLRPLRIAVRQESDGFRMTFSGAMTYEHSREIENQIIDALRRHPHLDVDLSAVDRIDSCGTHLLCMLKSYGGDAVSIVATSPSVEDALTHLPLRAGARLRSRRSISPPTHSVHHGLPEGIGLPQAHHAH